jgi:hypothetical protein
MKSIPSKSAAEAVKSLKEPLPFSTPLVNLAEVNWQLANEAPSDVKIGGSWAAGTSCKWKGKVGWVVEVYAEMSSVRTLWTAYSHLLLTSFKDSVSGEGCSRLSLLLQSSIFFGLSKAGYRKVRAACRSQLLLSRRQST